MKKLILVFLFFVSLVSIAQVSHDSIFKYHEEKLAQVGFRSNNIGAFSSKQIKKKFEKFLGHRSCEYKYSDSLKQILYVNEGVIINGKQAYSGLKFNKFEKENNKDYLILYRNQIGKLGIHTNKAVSQAGQLLRNSEVLKYILPEDSIPSLYEQPLEEILEYIMLEKAINSSDYDDVCFTGFFIKSQNEFCGKPQILGCAYNLKSKTVASFLSILGETFSFKEFSNDNKLLSIKTEALYGNTPEPFLFKTENGEQQDEQAGYPLFMKSEKLEQEFNVRKARSYNVLDKVACAIWCQENDLTINAIELLYEAHLQDKSSTFLKYILANFILEYLEDNTGSVMRKPVLYLYPSNSLNINLKFLNPELLTFTYPRVDRATWDVKASPSGEILNFSDSTKHRYLFWEGETSFDFKSYLDANSKVLVKTDTLVEFFKTCLPQLGLNQLETNDFITYWVPEMLKNEYNTVCFLHEDVLNRIVPIEITPKPDQFIRLFMLFEKATGKESYSKMTLEKKNRQGYHVIEWGGTELNNQGL